MSTVSSVFAYSDFLFMTLPFRPLAQFSVMLAVFFMLIYENTFMYFGFKLLVSLFLIAEHRTEGLSALTSLGTAGLERKREEQDEWHGRGGQERQEASLSRLPHVQRPAASQGLVRKSGKCLSGSSSAGEKREKSYLLAVVSCWLKAHPKGVNWPTLLGAQTWCWVAPAGAVGKLMVAAEAETRYEVSYPGSIGTSFFENTRRPLSSPLR